MLRGLEAADGPVPLTVLAEAARMSPSKAYVYLVSFVDAGLVRQDPATGRYGLGTFATQLGFTALRQMDVMELSREELHKLAEETGFAAHVSVWGNRGPVLGLKVDGRYQGSMMLRLGHVFSLQYSATGRVFLAHLPPSLTKPILALEKAVGIQDRPMLPRSRQFGRANLELIREQGYASSEHATSQGFFGIAVPIFGYGGDLAAAITLFGPAHRLTRSSSKRYAEMLKFAAQRISVALGGTNSGARQGK